MSSRLDPSLVDQPPPALCAALEARLEAALKAEAELRRHLEAQNADPGEHDDPARTSRAKGATRPFRPKLSAASSQSEGMGLRGHRGHGRHGYGHGHGGA